MFQCRTQHFMWCNGEECGGEGALLGFNAARSILCGATGMIYPSFRIDCFNAARSILCGATPSLAALVPRGARGRFGKSSIFCAVSPL